MQQNTNTLSQIQITPGKLNDYDALSRYHYRAGRPATVSQVWILQHHAPNIISQFTRQPQPPQTIGILITSYPSLNCLGRRIAIPHLNNILNNKPATAKWLNHNIRTISRVVIHPRWRSLGLAVKLVKHAIQHSQTCYLEALAVMGHIHPFLEKAGMTPYHQSSNEHTPLYYLHDASNTKD